MSYKANRMQFLLSTILHSHFFPLCFYQTQIPHTVLLILSMYHWKEIKAKRKILEKASKDVEQTSKHQKKQIISLFLIQNSKIKFLVVLFTMKPFALKQLQLHLLPEYIFMMLLNILLISAKLKIFMLYKPNQF